jgi:Patatin-like phospholipase
MRFELSKNAVSAVRAFRLCAAVAVALSSAACGSGGTATRTSVSAAVASAAQIPNMTAVRHWGDRVPNDLDMLVAERDAQLRATRPQILTNRKDALNFLALSGGAGDGAFGAGVLNGWTAAGTRPEFEVVTGISTGALMAPLAFLGPRYDPVLQEVYTQYGTADLVNYKFLTGTFFGGSALTGNNELRDLIHRIVTEQMLNEVAGEHARGRRLYVGTTNLDAQRPVIWDMGRIASSAAPNRLALFRDVLQASAAVPGLLPPVLINVESAGQALEEVHVDGGATAEVFFLPPQIILSAVREKPKKRAPLRLFVISNGRMGPDWAPVQPSTFPIITRSINTLLLSQWISDLRSVHGTAKSVGIEFRLLGVPATFARKPKETFDKAYMRELFDFGYGITSRNQPWLDAPPRFAGP